MKRLRRHRILRTIDHATFELGLLADTLENTDHHTYTPATIPATIDRLDAIRTELLLLAATLRQPADQLIPLIDLEPPR